MRLTRFVPAEALSGMEQEVIAGSDQYEFHMVYQKISQFVAVELSAIYHDVVKDRLYTDLSHGGAISKRQVEGGKRFEPTWLASDKLLIAKFN